MNRNLVSQADAAFTKWQKGLIFEEKIHRAKWDDAPEEIRAPIRERQSELIDVVRGGPAELVQYLRERLGLESDQTIEAPPFPRRELTPSEYKDPPVELEKELGTAWNEALEHRAALASSPLFWLLCHIVWIEDGRLGADGLALEEALLSGAKKRERRIRNFLRRTGGLPRVRGNTSVFSDCLLARSWWRFHLAGEVNRTTEGHIEAGVAHWLFHLHRPSWETLVTLSLKRVTTINQPGARAAIVYHLVGRVRTNGGFNQGDVKAIATGLARVSLRRSLDYTPLEELYEVATEGRRY